jgi:hypothetical protein
LWLPAVAPVPEASAHPFAEVEMAEFQGSGDRALPRYQELARSADAENMPRVETAFREELARMLKDAQTQTRCDPDRKPMGTPL